jgi:hypothetical protein
VTKQQEKFMALARKRLQRCIDAERENREEAKTDLKFVAGDQWDPKLKRARETGLNPRPALVFQKLTGPIQQVSNEARQNRPTIKTAAIDSGATKELSDVYQGIIRHIVYSTNGDVAGEIALDNAVKSGFGYLGFTTRYVDPSNPDNWDQEIAFRSFQNQFVVYLDPDAQEPDKSDSKYGFVLTKMSREEHLQTYKDAELGGLDFLSGMDMPEHMNNWLGEDYVLVAEYWYAEETSKLITRGNQSRYLETRNVCMSLINGYEELEKTDWAGTYIPLIPVYGPEINIDGKVYRESLIRHARDPQRLHNFYKSVEAETIALAPRPKWVGATGQFKSDRNWANANMSNVSKLEYDPVNNMNTPEPPPRWVTFEPPVQALSIGALQSADDIKAATNVFDASLGARSNETSGKAIDARKFESDMANSHFLDNLARAYVYAGRQLVELIPKIYDTEREIRIVGEDEAQKVVKVNAPYTDPETGKQTTYMLSQGKYAVTVTTGPSYTTKRQESFDLFSDLSKAYPALMQVAGDIILRNSDIPGADAVADRLKKTLPPQLAGDQGGDNAIPPAAKAQMGQQAAMIQQMTNVIHQLSAKLENKQVEGETRIQVALINARAGITEAMINSHTEDARLMFQAELDQIDRQLAQAQKQHDNNLAVQAQQTPQQESQQQPQPQAA